MTSRSRPPAALAIRNEGRAAVTIHKTRARDLLSHIKRNMDAIDDAFFEIGTALVEIFNNQLHAPLGYQTFRELLEAEGIMGYVQARKLITVATLVDREAAIRLGPEKSYLLTRYAQSSDGADLKALLREGAAIDGRRIAEMTVRDLRDLTREAAAPSRKSLADGESDARRAAREAQVALRSAGQARAVVRAQRSRGDWLFHVTTVVDAGQLRRLSRAR